MCSYPRVVSLERHNHPTATWQCDDVTTGWVVVLQCRRSVDGVELTIATAEDVEVMTVKVNLEVKNQQVLKHQ